MTKDIRFGVIGCGLMGREFACAALRWPQLLGDLPKPVVLAACNHTEEKLRWFQRVPDTKYFYSDYRELLKNPAIDAVYCALPHRLHAEVYSAILRAGKHLLGEKPFGIDRAAAGQICQSARENPDSFVRCASEFAFFPAVQKMFQWYREGAFGQIIDAHFAIKHSSDMDINKPINWKRTLAENGRYGCMGDLGIHVLYLPLRLGIWPERVSAHLSDIVRTRPNADGQATPCETWDNATLLCDCKNQQGDGFPMTLEMKRMAPGCNNTLEYELYGLKLSAKFTTDDPNALYFSENKGREQAWTRLGLGQKTLFPVVSGSIFEFGFSDSILQMLAAFVAELSGADSAFGCLTPEEAYASHRILSAALLSQDEKRSVWLSEIV